VLKLGRTPAGARVVLADVVEVVLATIRELESGGRYDVGPNKARASGAYQYIPSTWRHEGGFAQAYLAPREIQDARARADVERILELYGGDVSMVPVMWYYPRAASDARWMDRVPNPAGGNRWTIREYQERWMERFVRNADDLLGTYVAAAESPAAVSVLSAFPQPPDHPDDAPPRIGLTDGTARSAAAAGVVGAGVGKGARRVPYELDAVTVSERTVELAARSVPPEATVQDHPGWMRSIVFPVLGPVAYANGWGDPRDGGARRHEGTDIIGVGMQPLLAATDGRITQFRLEPKGRSGVAISIRDADGWRYNYFHANNDTPATDDGAADDGFRLAPGLELGDEVTAGQIIGYMGDSGNAENSVAHLHFEIRDAWGRAVPSFWSLRAAEARQACTIGIGPWSTPTLRPQPDAVTDADLIAQLVDNTADRIDSAAAEQEREVWHTVVTPLYGEGQWVIDSDGRVIATGDAALIMPSRTLECAPGPAIPFGTDAAGWADYGHDTLTGTVLDGVELTGTGLDTGPLTGPQLRDMIRELSLGDPHEPLLEPVVFIDPATGEKIIVTFEPPPHDTTTSRPTASLI
jgi:murein DD-endopeptidase MepM/ murein hydrolase activator NlpD